MYEPEKLEKQIFQNNITLQSKVVILSDTHAQLSKAVPKFSLSIFDWTVNFKFDSTFVLSFYC
jgi:hypothetical protein